MTFSLNKKHIPNCLAILRILLAVPIILLLSVDTNQVDIVATFIWLLAISGLSMPVSGVFIIASFLWLLAGLTDYLDGYLSRKWQVQTTIGGLLDTTADKILVLSIMIFLCYLQRIDPIIVILSMSREIYLSGLRAVAGSKGIVLSTRYVAKWKTTKQIIGMFLFLIGIGLSSFWLYLIGYLLLWVSVVLGLISAFQYTLDFKEKCL